MKGVLQEQGLVVGGRHPGHGPDLGIADLAAAQGLVDLRKLGQSPGHPDLLPGGARGNAALEVEPVGGGAGAVAARKTAPVPFPDQAEQAVLGGIHVAAELREGVVELVMGKGLEPIVGQQGSICGRGRSACIDHGGPR
mgnify:CR=1 FL=1